MKYAFKQTRPNLYKAKLGLKKTYNKINGKA